MDAALAAARGLGCGGCFGFGFVFLLLSDLFCTQMRIKAVPYPTGSGF